MSKILVVDDDPDFLLICRSILEAEGYQVLAVAPQRLIATCAFCYYTWRHLYPE